MSQITDDPTQAGIVFSAKRGAWTAHVIDRNARSQNHGVSESCRYQVRLDSPDGYHTSWPIKYDNGRIGYEFNPPRDARRAVEACYRFMKD